MDGRGMTHVDITSFSMETDVKGRRGGDVKGRRGGAASAFGHARPEAAVFGAAFVSD